jgi:hypothetical protein
MTLDLDTFLVALYTIIDDLYQAQVAPQLPRGPGKRPTLSDSEVLTLALCAQWLRRSERAVVRYAREHWRAYFPRVLSQSAYHRRSRRLAGVLVHLGPQVAQALGAGASAYQVLDTVPVPLLRRCRGQYHRLFGGEAAIGTGGSDHDWYYGCKLLVAVTREGVITGFLLAPASTEDRWVADAFFCWRACPTAEPCHPAVLPPSHRRGGGYVGPTGPRWPRQGVGAASTSPYVADRGFHGAWWLTHWQQDYGACVLTPDDAPGRTGRVRRWQQARWRQIVETVNGQLTEVLGLSFPGARSPWGLLARVAAKVTALNLGIWLNRLFGRPDLALATLFSA